MSLIDIEEMFVTQKCYVHKDMKHDMPYMECVTSFHKNGEYVGGKLGELPPDISLDEGWFPIFTPTYTSTYALRGSERAIESQVYSSSYHPSLEVSSSLVSLTESVGIVCCYEQVICEDVAPVPLPASGVLLAAVLMIFLGGRKLYEHICFRS